MTQQSLQAVQLHFILAGYSAKAAENLFQLYLFWTEKKLPLLDGDEIATVYGVPHLITLEHHLNQMCKKMITCRKFCNWLEITLKNKVRSSPVSPVYFLAGLSRAMGLQKSNNLCNDASCNNHQFWYKNYFHDLHTRLGILQNSMLKRFTRAKRINGETEWNWPN